MTRARKTLIIIVSVIAVVIAATNIFLFYGLTGIIKKRLPEATKTSGMHIDFSRLYATLPSGTIRLSDLVIDKTSNGGTNIDHIVLMGKAKVNVGILSLPLGIVNLSTIDITNTRLRLSGRQGGRSTKSQPDDKLPETTETGETNKIPDATGRSQPDTISPKTTQSIPKAVIGTARINTVVEYTNPTNNTKLALDLRITADNLRTFGDQDKDQGSFAVKGNLEGKPNSLVIDIKGSTAPFSIPGKPSFEINGTITNICTRDFKEMAESMGIEADCIDFDINVKCAKGVYIIGKSAIRTKITNLKLVGKSAGKARGMSIASLSVSVPLKGTFEKPEFDLIGALINTFTGNIDTMIKSINVDQKNVDKKVDKFLNSILGGKKKKN